MKILIMKNIFSQIDEGLAKSLRLFPCEKCTARGFGNEIYHNILGSRYHPTNSELLKIVASVKKNAA